MEVTHLDYSRFFFSWTGVQNYAVYVSACHLTQVHLQHPTVLNIFTSLTYVFLILHLVYKFVYLYYT